MVEPVSLAISSLELYVSQLREKLSLEQKPTQQDYHKHLQTIEGGLTSIKRSIHSQVKILRSSPSDDTKYTVTVHLFDVVRKMQDSIAQLLEAQSPSKSQDLMVILRWTREISLEIGKMQEWLVYQLAPEDTTSVTTAFSTTRLALHCGESPATKWTKDPVWFNPEPRLLHLERPIEWLFESSNPEHISSLDASEIRHMMLQESRLKEIGSWILSSSELQIWLEQSKRKIFWLTGEPGSGKSTLMSYVVDSLLENEARDQDTVVAYYYFSSTAPTEANVLLRALVRQLIYRSQLISNLSLKSPGWIDLDHQLPVGYDTARSETIQPSMQELLSEFLGLASEFSRIIICVDGLDECYEPQEAMKTIQSILTSSCKFFITSRYNTRLSKPFPELDHALRVNIVDRTGEDIDRYISNFLQKNSALVDIIDTHLESQVSGQLRSKARGSFLWVELALQRLLQQTNASEVKDTLNSLPLSTHDLILDRVRDQSRKRSELALRVLTWLSYSRRPLTLHELQHAVTLIFGSEPPAFNQDRVPPPRLLKEVCIGLLDVDEKRNQVRLIHATLSEYLLEHRNALFPDGESVLTRSCLTYMSELFLRNGPCETNEKLNNRMDHFPLLKYVSQNWGYHVRAEWSEDIRRKVTDMLLNPQLLASLNQVASINLENDGQASHNVFVRDFSALHLCAFFNLLDTMKNLIETVAFDDCLDSLGRTPLHIASKQGHVEICRLLLSVNSSLSIQDAYGRSELHYGVMGGHIEVAKLLIEHGADLSLIDSPADYPKGRSALEHAAYLGYKDILRTLLEKCTDTRNSLCLAAESGHYSIVEMLLTYRSDYGKDQALLLAAANGSSNIVGLLFENGANILQRDGQGRTPLHLAACGGHSEVVQVLLEAGASMDTGDHEGRSALLSAAEYGHKDVVELLFKAGDSMEKSDYSGETALIKAAANGHSLALRYILRHSNSLNTPNVKGRSALSFAASTASLSVVKLLLSSRNIDMNLVDTEGRTAILYAAIAGNLAVIDKLLQAGTQDRLDVYGRGLVSYAAEHGLADLLAHLIHTRFGDFSADKSGRSPLLYAAMSGHLNCVDVILASGVIDPNLPDNSGKTALMFAVEAGHEAVVRKLFESTQVDKTAMDHGYLTAFSYASKHGRADILEVLSGRPDMNRLSEKTESHDKTAFSMSTID